MRPLLIPAIGLPTGEHISDARLFVVALLALGGCILWQGIVAWRHRRALRDIPVRIHVAGTRGKSTTTRLIAAALRAGGRRVVAKTTGSEPRLILPDGRDEIWPRRGPATIREQVGVVRRAAQLGADTIVVECMAIRPEFVFASEHHLIEATTAVITNTRADHLEDIGESTEASAQALAWSMLRQRPAGRQRRGRKPRAPRSRQGARHHRHHRGHGRPRSDRGRPRARARGRNRARRAGRNREACDGCGRA